MRPPRGDAVLHHAFVKLAQVEGGTTPGLIILTQRQHRPLTKEVAPVGGIVRNPRRFLQGGGSGNVGVGLTRIVALESLLDDQVLGVVCPPVLAAGRLREGAGDP